MTGDERCTLYVLAFSTGLRRKELASLTKASFDLNGETSTVRIKGRSAKGKRTDVITLGPGSELVIRLRKHLANKLPTAPAFKLPTKPTDMLRFDLKAAGIPYRDDAGLVFDFHAQRTQFVSDVFSDPETDPKVAGLLARHQSPATSLKHYAKARRGGEQQARHRLPTYNSATAG